MLAIVSSLLAPFLVFTQEVSEPAVPESPIDEPGAESPLGLALGWLDYHQDDDGRWDADEFMKHDPPEDKSGGPGHKMHDVGITGLALLAFLAEGPPALEGPYAATITSGLDWLVEQQDPDRGLLGGQESHAFLYDHGIATRALCEAVGHGAAAKYREPAQLAVDYVIKARNPYGAWRYDVPPIGDNDTSITGWMVLALVTAQEAGLAVDQAALDGALNWFDQVSDPATGRCGYDSFGSMSSRTPDNEHYPRESGEAMTGIALICRYALGQTPQQNEILDKHAGLLLRSLPLWEPEKKGFDMYYWYYGTLALAHGEAKYWKPWRVALVEAVTAAQCTEGPATGSWDPLGPWGYVGGRIYSTAMMAMCLQIEKRTEKK